MRVYNARAAAEAARPHSRGRRTGSAAGRAHRALLPGAAVALLR